MALKYTLKVQRFLLVAMATGIGVMLGGIFVAAPLGYERLAIGMLAGGFSANAFCTAVIYANTRR